MIGFSQHSYKKVSDILLPITATTINRSYTAFEFFTLVNGKPFYIERHLNRLFTTLHLLRIDIKYTKNELINIISELINQNPLTNISYKIFVIPEPYLGYQQFKGELYIFPIQQNINSAINLTNKATLIVKNYQRFLPQAKTTNYTAHIFWENEVQLQQAIDVLYIANNWIRETSRSNVFIVKNNTIFTPKNEVLQGITKSIVIDLIDKNKFCFLEQDFTLYNLLNCDELFITSTTREITAITMVDTHLINNGKIGTITTKLQLQFKELKDCY